MLVHTDDNEIADLKLYKAAGKAVKVRKTADGETAGKAAGRSTPVRNSGVRKMARRKKGVGKRKIGDFDGVGGE